MQRAAPKFQFKLSQMRASGLVASVLVFSVFTNLLMLTGPIFMLQVYDRVLGSRSEETLVALFGLVAVLFGFYGLLEFARGRVMARVGARFQEAIGARVFLAVMEKQALRQSGGAGAHQNLDAVRALFNSPVLLAFLDLPWTPVLMAAIFIFHPFLGWLSMAGGVVLILVTVANRSLTAGRLAQIQNSEIASQRLQRQLEEGSQFVWAQGMAGVMTARWSRLQDETLTRLMTVADWTGGFSAFSKASRFLLQSTMLALGAWLVLRHEITAGAMIAASILLGRALAPIEQVIGQWPVLQGARTGWMDLQRFMQDIPARPNLVDLPPPAARISARGITVVLRRGDRPVLRNISFDLAPGQALGIIGTSGSGKTTLARTLVGLIPPAAGELRFDNATLDQYGSERLGAHIGYLPQEIVLFDGTIAENIAQMAEVPQAAKVVAAARKAKIHNIILNLPDGYNTRLGGSDTLLSGGQKQRLALARALYNDPVLLVLDEPNSALDAEGSNALNAVVTAMKAAGKGAIIMTHRPTAIAACDRILVLDRGRTCGYGPRDEVIRSLVRNADDVQRAVLNRTDA